MAYYSVLDVTPNNQDWIPGYLPVAIERVSAHGGKYLARTDNHEQVEGDAQPAALRVIIEWPSKEAALAFINDPEYAPHLRARIEGSTSHHFLIEALDERG